MTPSAFRGCIMFFCVTSNPGWLLLANGQDSRKISDSISQQTTGRSSATALEWTEPMESRVELRLTVAKKEVDIIEPDDLVIIREKRGDGFLVRTFRGAEGDFEKANLSTLAESVDAYDELIKSQPAVRRLYALQISAQISNRDGESALKDCELAIPRGYETADPQVGAEPSSSKSSLETPTKE